jgi:hypothetical protein
MKKILILLAMVSSTFAQANNNAAVVTPGILKVMNGTTVIANGDIVNLGSATTAIIKIENTNTATSKLIGTIATDANVTDLSNASFSINKSINKNFTFTLANVAPSGTKDAVVTINSNDVNITFTLRYTIECFTPLVSLTNNAVDNTINKGTSVTFTATTTNAGTSPSFTWYKNNVVISGKTSSTYTTGTLANGDLIQVEATANTTLCLTSQTTTKASNGITVTNNLTVSSNAALSGTYDNITINSGNPTLNGGLLINGALLIKAGASLDIKTNTIIVNGTVELENGASFLETGNNGASKLTAPSIKYNRTESHTGYSYIATPFTSTTGAKGYYYDELNRTADNATGWKVASGNYVIAKGYAINGLGSVTLTGTTFNNGPISINATYTNLSTPTTKNGWNLLGNPYPQPIKVKDFINSNNTIPAVYYWNGTSYTAMSKLTNGGADVIPSGQGFFARVTTNKTISFDNSQRTTASNSLLRTSSVVSELSLSLNGVTSDQTSLFFEFDSLTSEGYDESRDALKKLTSGVSELFSLVDNQEIALNCFTNDTTDKVVPLGVTIATAGTFTIATQNNTSAYSQVLLTDKLTGTVTDLTQTAYSFNASTAGKVADRFTLQLPAARLTATVDNNQISSLVKVYDNGNRSLTINGATDVVRVLNLTGTEIYLGNASAINVPTAGLYLIETLSNNTKLTHKVLVK